jgi:hypothetical protein
MNLHVIYENVLLTYRGDVTQELPSVRKIEFKADGDIHTIWYDERDNTIEPFGNLYKTSSVNGRVADILIRLKKDLDDHKLENPSLGNIDTGAEIEYSAERHLMIKDFFEFLKSKNRDNTINKILN